MEEELKTGFLIKFDGELLECPHCHRRTMVDNEDDYEEGQKVICWNCKKEFVIKKVNYT